MSTQPAQTNGALAPTDGQPVLSISKLNHTFGEGEMAKHVLIDITLEVMPRELVILTGPSGCGKTTLLTLVGALRTVQKESTQSVRVLGRELREMTSADLVAVRRNIGFIFQAHNLFDSLTAQQNVRMALELEGSDAEAVNARALKVLTQVGLGEHAKKKPWQLSGGMKQRVAIARALANAPRLILADEPTAALDWERADDVIKLFRDLATEGSTLLVVTHDNRIFEKADRIVKMVGGRIIFNELVTELVARCRDLRKCEMLGQLNADALYTVAARMTLERFEPGAAIIRQGERGEKFYLIRRGSVEVFKDTAQRPRQVARLGEGDFFGEIALVNDSPRNATVICREPLEVYSLPKQDFLDAKKSSESFDAQLREIILRRTS
jgi:putative ABC transport system ATP-binding protein